MKHRATPRFWECYAALPADVKKLADKSFWLIVRDPRHPSLRLKRIGPFWSVRVSAQYRALAVADGEDFAWVWVGSHDEYARMVSRR